MFDVSNISQLCFQKYRLKPEDSGIKIKMSKI